MDERFAVVFRGEVKPGADIELVQQGLARLFGQPLEHIATLFDGQQVTIKSDIDRITALRYQSDMARVGAISHIRSQGVAEDVAFGSHDMQRARAEVDSRDRNFSLSGVFASVMVCPRCGHQQLAGEFCAQCRVSFKALELEERRRRKRETIMARREAEAAEAAQIDTSIDHSEAVELDSTELRPARSRGRSIARWAALAIMLIAVALLLSLVPLPG